MKAWQYHAYGEPLALLDLPDPTCPVDGVVIAVAATGVCRSDWHAWLGHDPVPLPQIPGHEFAGTVAEVGAEVRGWAVGHRMTVPFVLGCGVCPECRSGNAQVCRNQEQPGFTLPGSFAELVAVPRADFNLVRLPDEVDAVAAAALGCRFATAFRALTGPGRIGPGQWLAVHGCGGVGLSALMIGAALGARVVAVDRAGAALELAAALGAHAVVDATATDDPAGAIAEITGGGAHVSMDAVGHPDVAAQSIRSLRRRGRHLQVGLLLGEQANARLPMDRVITWELQIFGSHGMPAIDYPGLLDLVASGAVDPGKLVGQVIPIDAAGAALENMTTAAGPGLTVVHVQR